MSGVSGTIRGTPSRGQSRPQMAFDNSPSGIPRPKLGHESTTHSETATSTLSANRQKQYKRDEVRDLCSMVPIIK